MVDYKDFELNDEFTAKPWGPRETQAFQDVIDTLVSDCVDNLKDVTGHKHDKLYNPSKVVSLQVIAGGVVRIANLSTDGVVINNASGDLSTVAKLPIANGGTNSDAALVNDRVMISSGGAIIESPSISVTELGLLDGMTGLATGAGDNDKFATQGYVDDAFPAVVPISQGGTNSSAALVNDRVMISSGGAIIESSTITTTELGLLDGMTGFATGAGDNDKFATQGYVDDAFPAVLPIAQGGTNSSTALNNDRVMVSSGGAIVESASVTTTELGLLDGMTGIVTGGANNDKFASQGYVDDAFPAVVPIAQGGTNSSSALVNGRVMVSSGGAIIESATVTTTELGLLNGMTGLATGTSNNDKFASQGYVDDAIPGSFWSRSGSFLYPATLTDSVGIGVNDPSSLLEVWDDDAHPVITITAAHNTAYDPQIKFGTDAVDTIKFSIGVDAGAGDAFKIFSGDGIGGTTEFIIDKEGMFSLGGFKAATGVRFTVNDGGAAQDTAVHISNFSTSNAIGPILTFNKSDNDSVGTLTQTDATDLLGSIQFRGVTSGSTWGVGAQIQAFQEDASGATFIPTYLSFFTSDGTSLDERVRIDKDGLVGVDTDSPLSKIHAATTDGSTNLTLERVDTSVSTNDVIGGVLFRGGESTVQTVGQILCEAAQDWSAPVSGSRLSFYTVTKDALSLVERMRITENGEMGINQTIPQSYLHIADGGDNAVITLERVDTSVAADDNIGALNFRGGESSIGTVGKIACEAAQDWSGTASGSRLTFHTTNKDTLVLAERMIIDEGGYFGLGNDPNEPFCLENLDNSSTLKILESEDGANVGASVAKVIIKYDGGSGEVTGYIRVYDSGS